MSAHETTSALEFKEIAPGRWTAGPYWVSHYTGSFHATTEDWAVRCATYAEAVRVCTEHAERAAKRAV